MPATPGLRNDGLERNKLVISANGSVTGSGANGPVLSGAIEFAKPRATGTKVTGIELATLRTDEAGRLLVVGGPGTSGSPLNAKIDVFSDNDGWYDSVSDGSDFGDLAHQRTISTRCPGVGARHRAPIRSRHRGHCHLV